MDTSTYFEIILITFLIHNSEIEQKKKKEFRIDSFIEMT